MADLIEPTHFDAVVISSGLPEVLLASALARAGKAVLVLDPADNYGSTWASLSGADFVHKVINSSIYSSRDHDNGHQQQPAADAQQHSGAAGDACSPAVWQQDCSTAQQQQQQQYLKGVQDCSIYTHPSLEQALDNKGVVIDLAPRVLYQDEPLVHLLVSCNAHNYLEFKLVEGHYVYRGGQLQPVPASRADLFADRALSLADKRSLGRFMAACVEAAEGSGRLKDAFDSRPLIDLLAAEGLNHTLQQVVLYGIAMADVPQHATPHQQHDPTSNTQQQQQQGQQLTAAEGLAAFVQYSRSLGRFGGTGALMAPCCGCGSLIEAFVRLAAVKGAVTALRHTTRSIHLLPDAAAVYDTVDDAAGGPASAGLCSVASAAADASSAQPDTHTQQLDDHKIGSSACQGSGSACAADEAQPHIAAAAAAVAADEEDKDQEAAASAGPVATAPARVCLTLGSGQSITAGCVVGSSSSGSVSNNSSTCKVSVARAVAIIDGSLVEGDTSLLFVIPPGTLGPQQTAVIKGLQFGHALAVAPPGHCLLYLSAVLTQPKGGSAQHSTTGSLSILSPAVSTAATGLSEDAAAGGQAAEEARTAGRAGQWCCSSSQDSVAEQVLGPALAALAATQQLQQFEGPPEQSDSQASSTQQQQGGQQQEQEQMQGGSSGTVRQQPQVLAACFYMTQQELQEQNHNQHQGAADSSSCILQCPAAPVAGCVGYSSSIQAAEALFRQHFSDLPWLTDQLPQAANKTGAEAAAETDDSSGESRSAAGAAGASSSTGAAAGGGSAGAGMYDDELDAIDELTAALLELSTGLEATPGQVSSTELQL